jgi:predicted site-specific integrase-resolvase
MAEQTRPEFGRAGDVARLFHVSPKTVARWSDEGKLPHTLTLGGHRRYPLHEVRKLAAGARPTQPAAPDGQA